MNIWQTGIVFAWLLYSALGFFLAFKRVRKNPYGLCPHFTILGAFVWADLVAFGAFFTIASIVSLVIQNFTLFLLVISVFWLVRSIGEQIYWFLEQFAEKHRNKPSTLFLHNLFPGDSIYIYQQIFWQCIVVVTLITSVLLFARLLNGN